MTNRQTQIIDNITDVKQVTSNNENLINKRTFSALVYIIDITGQIQTANNQHKQHPRNSRHNLQPLTTGNNTRTQALYNRLLIIQARAHGNQTRTRKHTRAQKHTRPRRAGTPYIAVQCMTKTAEGVSDFGREILKKGNIFCEGNVLGNKKVGNFQESEKEKRGYFWEGQKTKRELP